MRRLTRSSSSSLRALKMSPEGLAAAQSATQSASPKPAEAPVTHTTLSEKYSYVDIDRDIDIRYTSYIDHISIYTICYVYIQHIYISLLEVNAL